MIVTMKLFQTTPAAFSNCLIHDCTVMSFTIPIVLIQSLLLLATVAQETLTKKLALSSDQHGPNAHTQYTESASNVRRLVLAENKWYEFLKGKFEKNDGDMLNGKDREIVTNYTRRYEVEVVDGLKHWKNQTTEELALFAIEDHPFLILRMYRRLSSEAMRAHSVVSKITGLMHIVAEPLPTKNDTERFSTLILLASYFHDFDVYKFAQGNFGGVKTGVRLSSMQALHLALISRKINLFATSVILTTYGLELAFQHAKITEKELMDVLQEAIDEHDKALSSRSLSTSDVFTEKIREARRFLTQRGRFLTTRRHLLHTRQDFTQSDLKSTMMLKEVRVCSATEDLRSFKSRSKLRCWYSHPSPITPYKIELLNEDPVVYKIHEFVSSRDQIAIQTQAASNLKPPDERFRVNDEGKVLVKAGMVASLSFQELGVGYIENKIQYLFGRKLNNSSASKFEVFSMIPGGHYTLAPDDDIAQEDATAVMLLLHLNQVKLGGRTNFAELKFSEQPNAGSAVVWFSHHEDGRVDKRVVHGSCPVVLGHKWVATMRLHFQNKKTKSLWPGTGTKVGQMRRLFL